MAVAPSATWIRQYATARQWVAALPILFAFSSIAVWILSLSQVDLERMNDLGLVSVLPAEFFIAVILLTCGFCLSIRQATLRVPMILVHVIILIIMLYGTPALVEEAPRFSTNWKHLGITDYIMRHGEVNPRINTYFNWPGFFTLAAFVTEMAGLPSLVDLVAWIYVFFNLLFLAPLVMLFSSVTRDARLVWLAVWLFYVCNWVGQDYFSPQAFAYFLYIVVLAALVRWFKSDGEIPSNFNRLLTHRPWRGDRVAAVIGRLFKTHDPDVRITAAQRTGLVAIVVVVLAAMIPSHQLTPFAALLTISFLAATYRIAPRSLPLLLAVFIFTWMLFVAVPYIKGHLGVHLATVGEVGSNADNSVTGRLKGSDGHLLVVRVRILMAIVVSTLAIFGGIRRFVDGHLDVVMVLLVVGPSFLIGAQNYGGEMALRVYFFVLPGLAFFVAALLFRESGDSQSGDRVTWPTLVSIGAVSLLLCTGFLISRYGNERMDYLTAEEVSAVNYLFHNAEPGAVFWSPGSSLPWDSQNWEIFRRESFGWDIVTTTDVSAIEERMNSGKENRESYLILTRSVAAQAEMYIGLQPGAVDRFEQTIRTSEDFTVVFENEDATIFILSENSSAMAP